MLEILLYYGNSVDIVSMWLFFSWKINVQTRADLLKTIGIKDWKWFPDTMQLCPLWITSQIYLMYVFLFEYSWGKLYCFVCIKARVLCYKALCFHLPRLTSPCSKLDTCGSFKCCMAWQGLSTCCLSLVMYLDRRSWESTGAASRKASWQDHSGDESGGTPGHFPVLYLIMRDASWRCSVTEI